MNRSSSQNQGDTTNAPDRSAPSILIVDDHPAVRAGLRNLISSRPGWFICGEATNGEQAVSLALELKPSVVVMDISMPGMDGLEATRRIRDRLTSVEVLIVSQHDSDQVVSEAQRAGARGFVVKSHLSADLLPALEAALLHSSRISTPVSKAWHDAISTAKQPAKGSFQDPGPHDDLDLMSGGGEMGALMRAHDWAKTPFGAVSQWPQSLRTALRICLDSRFPILIWWGPELRLLYNDAYMPALGSTKHPRALGAPGKDVWWDIWDTVGPMLEGVTRTGRATWENDQVLLFDRHGYVEETYWTYSYSAIRLASGEIGGVFSAIHEVTDRVLSARRLKTLREVADQVVQAKNEIDACSLAMQSMMRNPADCPYAMIFLCEGNQAKRVAASFDAGRQVPSIVDLSESEAWAIREAAQTLSPCVFDVEDAETLPGAPYGDKCKQAISLPIVGTNRNALAVLTVGISPYRKLDESYRLFFESLAKNLAANINNARAYDEERKRAEALAELDRAKTVFFSNVSHEFRTPLTLMLGPLEDSLAHAERLLPEDREHLELAHRNSVRLLRLVNTLLDFSRIEAGRMQASYEPTDLPKFTAELASVFRSATERAGLKLVIHCPALGEPVYVDREMWEKIVLNLLSNAFKFTFEGEIEVSLQKNDGAVELSVRDTGTGIPEKEVPRLFERFYRAKGAHGRTFEGSGIGLSLVQELARLHGGSVSVKSQEHRGSTFSVTVPLGTQHLPADRISAKRTLESTGLRSEAYVQEALRWLPQLSSSEDSQLAALLSPTETLPKAQEKTGRPVRILLADDNADMRDYVHRLLSEHYTVVSAADGESALRSARENPPDLILSDVMMPRLDGFGLLQAIRSDTRMKNVPVILLSARAGEESRIEGLQSGADDYLVKPFSARELFARVQTHLELSRVRRKAEEDQARRTTQFETLLNAAPQGIYLVDADFRIQAATPRARKAFGEFPDLIGRDFEELIRGMWEKEYADEILKEFRHTLETGEAYFVPERMAERIDRKTREVYKWEIHRILLADGRYGVVCYFEDISILAQAREVISRSEKQLRLATDAAGLGIWEWYPDTDRTVWQSPRLYDIFGRSPASDPPGLNEFVRTCLHPEDEGPLRKVLREALDSGKRYSHQCRIQRPDGDIRWVEITGQLEPAKEKSPRRIVGTVQDITDNKLAEQTLRASEERMRIAQEVAKAGTWELDLESGRIIRSQELDDLYGIPIESGRDLKWWKTAVHPEDLSRTELLIQTAVEQKQDYHAQFRIRRPNGELRWIAASGKVMTDETGKPTRIIGVDLDITERRRAEEELNRARAQAKGKADDLAAILDAMPSLTFIAHDRECSDITSSRSALGLMRRPQGTNVSKSNPNHPQDYKILENGEEVPTQNLPLQMAARTGTEVRDRELRLQFDDGRSIDIFGHAVPLRNEAGEVRGAVGMYVDVTERKLAQDRERQVSADAVAATAKFRAVFEQTTVFAGVMTKDGVLIEANRISLEACGYRAEEVMGKPFWETAWWRNHFDAQVKIREAIPQVAKGVPYRETMMYSWADGTEHIVDFALYPIVDDRGQVLYLHPTGIDVTDLTRIQENYRKLVVRLDAEVRARTLELEQRTADLVRQSEQLRELSWRLLHTQEEERRHIARELHDSAGQTLTVLGINLAQLAQKAGRNAPELAGDAEMIQETVQQLHREIRTTSYLLHPPLLDEAGLTSALHWYVSGLEERSGLKIELSIADDFGRLPSDMELLVFRLVQECLTNIHRHSGSKTASIRVSRGEGKIVVDIRDQGKGMSAERLAEIQSRGSGVGIRGMRERLLQFNGQMKIESGSAGTWVSVSIPIAKTALSQHDEMATLPTAS